MCTVRRASVWNAPPIGKSLTSKLLFVRDLLWVIIITVPLLLWNLIRTFKNEQQKSLKNKIVLITGTGNGLGKELAFQLSSHGCKIVCVDIATQDNNETARDINEKLGNSRAAKAYTCDVTDPDLVKNLARQVLHDVGHIDILIHNAGIVYLNSIEGGSNEMIEKVIRVNLLSAFWIVRSFLPNMKTRRKGHFVFVNSFAGIHGLIYNSVYVASKFGLLGLTHSLEDEFRKDPDCSEIKLTSIHPYYINSNKEFSQFWSLRAPPMSTSYAAASIITAIRKESFISCVPGGEWGYWMSTLIRLVPKNLYHIYRDTFYCDILLTKQGEVSLSEVARLAKNEELRSSTAQS